VLPRHRQRVYLTVFLDDFSRYVVSWKLATHQRADLVLDALRDGLGRFGKPKAILTDQGRQYFSWRGKGAFQKLLDREGIQHVVARSHHPQTVGKCERLWETLKQEFFSRVQPEGLPEARERLGHFFAHYNHFRPHQGIDGLVPADRFFQAEDVVRKTLEERLTDGELQQAVGETPRTPVLLYGQVGDRCVSLHGEKGRLVIQTEQGLREELGIEELGAPDWRNEESHDASGQGRGDDEAAAHAALPEAGALPAGAEDAAAGAVAVEGGQRGAAQEGARDVRGDAGALAGKDLEGGGGAAAAADAAAGLAAEPAGAGGHGGGPAQAAAAADRDCGGAARRAEGSPAEGRAPGEGAQAGAGPGEAAARSSGAPGAGAGPGGHGWSSQTQADDGCRPRSGSGWERRCEPEPSDAEGAPPSPGC